MRYRLNYLLLLSACVLLVTLVLTIDSNFGSYVEDFREQQSLEIYLHSSATTSQLETLISRVKALPGYRSFTVEDQDVAFERMQSLLGEELLQQSDRNPFPARIIVKFSPQHSTLANLQRSAPGLKQSSIVDTVTYNASWLAAQEQAFSRWHYVIVGTLLLSIIACLFALLMSVTYAEETSRGLLTALQLHGAGLGMIMRSFVGRWTSVSILASLLGIGVAYVIWRLIKDQFASTLFVDTRLLLILVLSTSAISLALLFFKSLRYR